MSAITAKRKKTTNALLNSLSVMTFILFMFLAYAQGQTNWLVSFDQTLTTPMRHLVSPFWNIIFKQITFFANTKTIVFLGVFIGLALLWQKQKWALAFLATNLIVGAAGLNQLAKLVFNRPRPLITHLVQASGTSFPSGHAMGSMLFYGSLILLAQAYLAAYPQTRNLVTVVATLIIFLVPISRIYLGVHFPSDVLAGSAFGFSCLIWNADLFHYFACQKNIRPTEKS